MRKTAAYAATSSKGPLAPLTIERREPGEDDVVIDILHCGVCHSDVHQVREEWGSAQFPMVPGHEIVGRVVEVGAAVKKLVPGDLAAVGVLVDSCRTCFQCQRGTEQFCEKGCAYTYNSTEMDRKTPTHGGYSTQIVTRERFVLKMPAGLDPAAAAPLLCAGITTYSPLREWKVTSGTRVGIVGLGGLGHVAVKMAVAMGAEVTVLSTSRGKEADAKKLGAHAFEVTTDRGVRGRLGNRYDMILDTASAPHDYNLYLDMLRPHGAMVLVGLPPAPAPVSAFALVMANRRLAGSNVGGLAETQEMLEFCAEHHITAEIEPIKVQDINAAYERLVSNDVKYRFVIDLASLR